MVLQYQWVFHAMGLFPARWCARNYSNTGGPTRRLMQFKNGNYFLLLQKVCSASDNTEKWIFSLRPIPNTYVHIQFALKIDSPHVGHPWPTFWDLGYKFVSVNLSELRSFTGLCITFLALSQEYNRTYSPIFITGTFLMFPAIIVNNNH